MRLYETERNGMPQRRFMPILILVTLTVTAVLLPACGTPVPAPIVSREYRQPPRVRSVQPARYYVVRRGDTLYSIAWKYGVDHRQLANWNRIPYPYTIYPGQHIVVTASSVRRISVPRTSARSPVGADRKPSAPVADSNKPRTSRQKPDVAASNVKLRWQWPTKGKITRTFSAKDQTRKGIEIAGQFGQEVQAAESGKVVYSGSGLIGYGKLIIVKHNGEYLSAYGHNRKLLVKEGDQVSRGMRIAEMGENGAGGAVLHFEVRHNGIPVDPLALLPRR